MKKFNKQNYFTLAISLILIIAIFVLNLYFPLGIAGGVLYIAIIMLSLWLPGRRFTSIVGIISLALTIIGFYLSPSANYTKTIFENRVAVIALIIAAIVFIWVYKTWEYKLKENEEKLQALFEAATEGIIITNAIGVVVLINQMGEKLFGYKREEIIGKNIDILLPEDVRKQHAKYRLNYYKDSSPRPMGQGMELFALKKNGEKFPVEISLNFFETEEGLFVISYIADITLRKTMESDIKIANQNLKKSMIELKRSNAELEQFAYLASHDLQEPLRMVASYTELLERRYKNKLDDDANDFIHFAVDGARRMQNLINDLLQFSRVGTKARPFARTDCNLVLEIAQTNLKELIKETKTKIHYDKLPTIQADETQLIQLFQNLIHNAIKFKNQNDPEISISVNRKDGFWQFRVSDNGIGIDPVYKDRIFMIFQRLHARSEYPGSGIGLAICKKIVERHNGNIWYEPTEKEGTTFYFTIDEQLK